MNRCIACYRCVRYYKDYADSTDWASLARTTTSTSGRPEDGTLERARITPGNLVEVCPTSVTDKTHSECYIGGHGGLRRAFAW